MSLEQMKYGKNTMTPNTVLGHTAQGQRRLKDGLSVCPPEAKKSTLIYEFKS